MPRTLAGTRTTAGQRQIVRDFGTCLLFNGGGAASYVDIGNNASLRLSSAFTLCAWVKLTSRPQGSGVITHIYDGLTTVNYEIGYGMDEGSGGSSKLKVGFYDGSWRLATSTIDYGLLDIGIWTFIAGTWDGTTLIIYRNGTSVGTSTPGGTPPTGTQPFRIGVRHDSAGSHPYLPGFIDDPRIYKTNLSPTQIQNLYYGIEPPTTNLVSRWKFDEGSGTTANDAQSSNTGTITLATYSTDVFMKARISA